MTAPWASLACTSWLNILGGQRRHRHGTVEPLHPALSPSPSRFLPPFLLPDLSTHKILFRKVALPPEATPRPCETVASPRGGWSLRCCGREGDPHAGTSLESPAPCARGCPAHRSCSALCPGSLPTPLSSGRQAEGRRRVLQPAPALRERASCVRPTTRPPMVARPVRWRCGGAANPAAVGFASARATCQPRMWSQDAAQCSRGAQDTAGTEAIRKYQLTPGAGTFTFLQFLVLFPSRSASLAGQHTPLLLTLGGHP